MIVLKIKVNKWTRYDLLRVKFWHLREDGHFYLIFISRYKLAKESLISCKEKAFTRENYLSQGDQMMEQCWTGDLWNSCSATCVCDFLGGGGKPPILREIGVAPPQKSLQREAATVKHALGIL